MLLLPVLALSAVPLPVYPECGEPDRPDLCPPDLRESWEFLSYVPSAWQSGLRAEEVPLGTGMWVDRAWRVTTGRPDVVIAVLDSGIEWDEPSLLRKHALNAAELPLPEGAETHDANGDGVFNIDDYTADPRVVPADGVDRADALLDPSDLIAAFSDGVDQDGNGYVDDIAGWDFFWNDNDPYDDTRFGHGTGMAEEAAAEGGDDDGEIGTCPSCMVLNLRVADGFVAELSPFAPALLYATDQGAVVVLDALGGIDEPSYVRAVIDDAWAHGPLVIGSAGDETAWHPNPPGAADHTFYVHAMRMDRDDPADASTFLSYSNCTNHGARLDGSAASTNCSSGATARTAGIAGLVAAAARDAGHPLSAGELHALLAGTVDDVVRPDDPGLYPAPEGWDTFFGHGRLNAARAVEAAAAGAIPPVADLTEPRWFTWHPAGEPLVVRGTATARAGVAGWRLELGWGLEPADWTVLAEGDGASPAVEATWDGVREPCVVEDHPPGSETVDREHRVNACTVTFRLTVTDTAGRASTERRAVTVADDPDRLPGWPLDLASSLESSPVLHDLDGDGVQEIVQADADGRVHALRGDGSALPGWPVRVGLIPEVDPADPANHLGAPGWARVGTELYEPIVATPAVGDLDGDGAPEVVAATMRGAIWAWRADGSVVPGFPVRQRDVASTDPEHLWAEGFLSSPALGDLDGDGALEIVVGGMDQHLYAVRADGSDQPGFPVLLVFPGYEGRGARIVSSPAVTDLDGDGRDDVVVGTNETLDGSHAALYAVSGDGESLAGWPDLQFSLFSDILPVVGEGFPGAVAVTELGDGTRALVAHGIAGVVTLVGVDSEDLDERSFIASAYGDGTNVSDPSAFPLINTPSVGDLDGDGVLDVVTTGTGAGFLLAKENDGQRLPWDHAVGAWSGADGSMFPGFPRVLEDIPFFQNPAVADLDGDGRMEVVTGTGGFVLHAWNLDGDQPAGWPKGVGQWIIASPAVGDVDGDGFLDVVVGTRTGQLFAWSTTSPSGAPVGWAMFGHDPAHSFDGTRPLLGYNAGLPETPKGGGGDGGCGCASGGSAPGWLGAVAAALVRRRRGSAG